MVEKRARALCARAKDLATIVEECSPSANPNLESKSIDVSSTLYIAGALDEKYSNLGKEWKALEPELKFAMVPDSGHALLTEAPNYVAHQISMFLLGTEKSRDRVEKEKSEPKDLLLFTVRELVKTKTTDTQVSETTDHRHPSSMDFEPFAIDINSGKSKQSKGVVGIGWGDKAKSNEQSRMQQRRGFIVQLLSSDGATVGIGEVSPLSGLHEESLKDAENDLERIKAALKGTDITLVPIINPMSVLALDGALGEYIDAFLNSINIRSLCSSVRAGLEMALISFSSHLLRKPVLDCLTQYAARKPAIQSVLPISGLIPRGKPQLDDVTCRYPSLKVKVGHQDASRDAASLSLSLHLSSKLRPDANRAWTEADALQFSTALDGLGVNLIDKIEFVEEPIQKVSGDWSLREQVQVLERWYRHSGLKYALDESIADLVEKHERDFVRIKDELIDSFDDVSGCAAVVLKPSLLGLELSLCIARIAHTDLGINVVFSCSFDSGVGLAYSAFLATTSDIISGLPANDLLPHGIGTFALLDGDTLSPSFGSYVNEKGLLGVASLSRSFFGLSLDEMKGSFPQLLEVSSPLPIENIEEYQASAATSSSGREISVVVSLPLPFSDDTACTRFTDLPQQSRWSPWLSSVAYIDADRESEWTLNVRGVKFSWRATSSVLEKPYKGIQWESISGLKNMGVVEFVPNEGEPDSCTMRVRMTIIAPRLLTALFPGASVFLEDFLRNKLLKWSLEMFRDVVKGDLALERGDMELGDALFGAVEGKANAIEATLSSPTSPVDNAGEENAA
jgi:o-succinylbenzoate synthase